MKEHSHKHESITLLHGKQHFYIYVIVQSNTFQYESITVIIFVTIYFDDYINMVHMHW